MSKTHQAARLIGMAARLAHVLAAQAGEWRADTTARDRGQRFAERTLGAARPATQPPETEIQTLVNAPAAPGRQGGTR